MQRGRPLAGGGRQLAEAAHSAQLELAHAAQVVVDEHLHEERDVRLERLVARGQQQLGRAALYSDEKVSES